jgi:hypothetical protein
VDTLPRRQSVAKAYILQNDLRGGSLSDGFTWGNSATVKVRKTGGGGKSTFYKHDEMFVDIPNPEIGEKSVAAGLTGFSKSKCQGVLICENKDCTHLKHFERKSVDCERQGNFLVCKGRDGLGCKSVMSQKFECFVTKYRLGLVTGIEKCSQNTQTAIVYHGEHSAECKAHSEVQCSQLLELVVEHGSSNVRERMSAGINHLCRAVVSSLHGASSQAVEHAEKGKMLVQNTAKNQMNASNYKKEIKNLRVEEVAKWLKSSSGMLIVPYHNPLGGLSLGPNATVLMQGCCRTPEEYVTVANNPQYKFCCANIMLASCDNQQVRALMDAELIEMMQVPVSFDVQHPNKVSGHFTMGYFSYVPSFRMMVNYANVMIPAIDSYNGLQARVGDNTLGNTHAKLALDFALRRHLECAFPGHDWSQFSYRPNGARVADEGHAGIQGQRSNDGDNDVAEASCEFHFKQQLDRLGKEFKFRENAWKFKQKTTAMVNEEFAQVFWGLYFECVTWLCSEEMRTEGEVVISCVDFLRWHFSTGERRERVVKAFKSLLASKSSVAEIGHAQQQRLGRLGITLAETVIVDAAHFERQASDISKLIDEGIVVRRKRGLDEYGDNKRKSIEAGRLQRKFKSYSAVSDLPMLNMYRETDVVNTGLRENTGIENEMFQNVFNEGVGRIQEKENSELILGCNITVADEQNDFDEERSPRGKKYSNASACNSADRWGEPSPPTPTAHEGQDIPVCKFMLCSKCSNAVLKERMHYHRCQSKSALQSKWVEIQKQNNMVVLPHVVLPVFVEQEPMSAEDCEKAAEQHEQRVAGREVETAILSTQVDATRAQGNALDVYVPQEDLVLVATHRHDRSIMDTEARTKVIFSTQPNKLQKKINGIRYGTVNAATGKDCVFIDVCGGRNIWAEEKHVDPKDIEHWQQMLSYDEVQRSVGISVINREKRYRTKSVGNNTAESNVRYRNGPVTHTDNSNLGRVKHCVVDDIVVVSSRGQADTILSDGQITMEVLFVSSGEHSASDKFQVQSMRIGYEPACYCGANCDERPCFHLLAFFILKCKMDPMDPLMWQVGLIQKELEQLALILHETNAVQPDGGAKLRLQSMIQQEGLMIAKGAYQRTITGDTREEANGARLLELKRTLTDGKLSDKLKGKRTAKLKQQIAARINTPAPMLCSPSAKMLQSILHRGGPGAEKAGLISPTHVSIESPKDVMELMNKTKRSSQSQEHKKTQKRRKKGEVDVYLAKAPQGLNNLPAGQARIYMNWTERKCYGRKCYHKILRGEWFVLLPMRSHFAEGLGKPSSKLAMYGFCLHSHGACLKSVDIPVAQHMKKLKFHIVDCLPVYIHGAQQLKMWEDSMLDDIKAMLPTMQSPYLVRN